MSTQESANIAIHSRLLPLLRHASFEGNFASFAYPLTREPGRTHSYVYLDAVCVEEAILGDQLLRYRC